MKPENINAIIDAWEKIFELSGLEHETVPKSKHLPVRCECEGKLTNNGKPHVCGEIAISNCRKDQESALCPSCLMGVDSPATDSLGWWEKKLELGGDIFDLEGETRNYGKDNLKKLIREVAHRAEKKGYEEGYERGKIIGKL